MVVGSNGKPFTFIFSQIIGENERMTGCFTRDALMLRILKRCFDDLRVKIAPSSSEKFYNTCRTLHACHTESTCRSR